MANYVLENIRVYKGTNSRGNYYWCTGELHDPIDPFNDPSQPRIYPMLTEKLVNVYRKVAVPDPADQSRAIVDIAKLREAKKSGQFADGTKYPSREMPDGSEFKFDFELANNIFPHDIALAIPQMRIATRDMDITMIDGTKRHILKGQPVPGKNGSIVPVTEIRVYIKHDADGNPIENPRTAVDRILERRYRPITVNDVRKPEAAPAEAAKPAEAAAEEAATQAAEEAALGTATWLTNEPA